MIELKKEINKLLSEPGYDSKYTIHEPGGSKDE